MKNILITGGAGFIGSNLSLKLIEKGYNVTVLDNLSNQIHGINPEKNSYLYLKIKNKVNFIKGDVTSIDDWIYSIKNQDAIIHLAAETGTGQSMYEINKYIETNVGGTAKMLDVLTNFNHNIKKIIIASSRSIYGEGKYWSDELNKNVYPGHRSDSDLLNGNFNVKYKSIKSNLKLVATDENSKIHPSSVYGITKQTQEQLIMTICPTIGINPVGFRYQNVYGPGQSLKNPYTGILSIFSNLILNHQELNIFEDGLESRDFVYIDDVISATIKGLEYEEANEEVFNVGSGTPTTVLKVAEELFKSYDITPKIKITGNYRLGDIRHNYADLTKIKSKLNFTPKIDFNSGIKNFTNWVKTQKIIINNDFDRSLEEMKNKGLFK